MNGNATVRFDEGPMGEHSSEESRAGASGYVHQRIPVASVTLQHSASLLEEINTRSPAVTAWPDTDELKQVLCDLQNICE
ncbi:unnamed protein product, partial [Polarella glacialis]